MKLQNLTVIFIIITLPIILLVSLYISTGLKTIRYQALYDTGLLTATQDAIQAFEANTVNNRYSDNPEEKRSIIKSSIKMFETSLCNTCNISAYNFKDIEEYIPAIVFGMYDGFYLYAPSLNPKGKYEHALKNYVYYSEILDEEKAIVIRYYLDSYVQVSGYFGGTYESREGYLINIDKTTITKNASGKVTEIKYYGINIDINDEWAVNYFIDNYNFSHWFKNIAKIGDISGCEYLKIGDTINGALNDPEDPKSAFVKHKNEVIRNKIEGVLNSTITAYSKRTWGQNYKMPKITEEEWERIYSDISVTTFFQGKRIGFTKYNGYCVLNSNNHYELINPNLLYFVTDSGGESSGNNPDHQINTRYDYYHDIRCAELLEQDGSSWTLLEEWWPELRGVQTLRGWKIGRFKKVKIEDTTGRVGTGPSLEYKEYSKYMYERAECACYECVSGSVANNKTVYEYINIATDDCNNWRIKGRASPYLTISYWTSLARERAKLNEKDPEPDFTITKTVLEPKVLNGGEVHYTIKVKNNADKVENITIKDTVEGTDNIEIKSSHVTGYVGTNSYTITKEEFKNEGLNVNLKKDEEIVISYVANIRDIDGDHRVTNKATATVVYEGSSITKDAKDTCQILKEAELVVSKKIKQGGTEVSKVGHSETVEYEIIITNTTPGVTDKITIEDIFLPEQITDIKNIKYTINGSVQGDQDGEVKRETGKLVWTGKEIGGLEQITITFTATLIGDIGNNVKNAVKVTSEYCGSEYYYEVPCDVVKEVQMTFEMNEPLNANVILVVDGSWSQFSEILKHTLENTVNSILNKCSNLYTGYEVHSMWGNGLRTIK